jgi:hypoxanthine phosphoribosyltransferase
VEAGLLTTYAHINWHDVETWAEQLARKRPKPKTIVAIGSGGLVLGKLLADRTGARVTAVWARSYRRGLVGERGKVEFTMPFALPKDVEPPFWVVDDIADSGRTMEFVTTRMKQDGYTPVRSVVLLWKRGSIHTPSLFAAKADATSWYVFPWDRFEFARAKP